MIHHPFVAAVERKVSREQLAALFSPHATFNAPVLSDTIHDTATLLDFVELAARVASPRYTSEFTSGPRTFLAWDGMIGESSIQGVSALTTGADGRICDLTVFMRPWPVVELFREAAYAMFGDRIPARFWELGLPSAVLDIPNRPTAREPKLALDVRLHSPVLANVIEGRSLVEQVLRATSQIQSPAVVEQIQASPMRALDLFKCFVEDRPLSGVRIFRFNSRGELAELSVLLRPWPTVSILRQKLLDQITPLVYRDDEPLHEVYRAG